MTQPQDPRKQPLQDDEIALARVLRALPVGEPSARVDDAILRAATDAVSPGRRKPAGGLRWLPTWAIGTAAAAVLAVGIGMQLRPPLAPEPQAGAVREEAKALPQARERLSVDLVEPDQVAAPPPASAPPEPVRSTRTPPPPPPPAPPVPMPAPPSPVVEPQAFPAPREMAPAAEEASAAEANAEASTLDSIEVTGTRLRSEATDQARRTHQEGQMRRAQAKASAEAERRQGAAASDAPAAAAAAAAAPAAAPAPAAGASRDAFAEAEMAAPILPPVADDAQLPPAAWLERIRERLRQGDRAGARASLGLFTKAHPGAPVPSDLAPLR